MIGEDWHLTPDHCDSVGAWALPTLLRDVGSGPGDTAGDARSLEGEAVAKRAVAGGILIMIAAHGSMQSVSAPVGRIIAVRAALPIHNQERGPSSRARRHGHSTQNSRR